MFLTYLPTSQKAPRHETIFIEPSLRDKVSFRVPFSKSHNPISSDIENSLLDTCEFRPSFVLMQGFGIPLSTGVIVIDDGNSVFPYDHKKPLTIGYDSHKNSYQTLDPIVKPETFSECGYWSSVLNFDDLIFNLLARATGLKSNIPIDTPTRLKFKFKNEKFSFTQTLKDSFENCPEKKETYIVYHDKQWLKSNGETTVNLNTEELSTQDFDSRKSLMYMLEFDYNYRHGLNFKFNTYRNQNNRDYKILNINVPASIDDPDLGKKLYEELGIKFDIYDNVEMIDGVINPACFMDGVHHFGVLKSKVILLDKKAVEEIINKIIDEESILKSIKEQDDEETSIFDLDTKTRFDLDQFNFVSNSILNSYLAVNHEGDITDELLDNLLENWKINKLIDLIFKYERKNITENKTLLKSLIISKEVYVPIFTPRLDEHINAYLNPILHHKFSNNLCQFNILSNEVYKPGHSVFYF